MKLFQIDNGKVKNEPAEAGRAQLEFEWAKAPIAAPKEGAMPWGCDQAGLEQLPWPSQQK